MIGIQSGEHPPVKNTELTQVMVKLDAAEARAIKLEAHVVELKTSIPALVTAGVEGKIRDPQFIQELCQIGK